MEDLLWFKMYVNMFDNRKIKQIEKMPEGDRIIVIWCKLMCLCGKCNKDGFIYFTREIAYTDEMLANEFDRPLVLIRLALSVFLKFEMIEIIDDIYLLSGWAERQSSDILKKLREASRIRTARYRQNLKALCPKCDVTGDVTQVLHVTQCNAIDKDIDIELDNIYSAVIDYLNLKASTSYKSSNKKTQELIRARQNDGYVLDDFKKVIDVKCAKWLDNPDMVAYLRPSTLFSNKFESYLNEKMVKPKKDFEQRNYKKEHFENDRIESLQILEER